MIPSLRWFENNSIELNDNKCHRLMTRSEMINTEGSMKPP